MIIMRQTDGCVSPCAPTKFGGKMVRLVSAGLKNSILFLSRKIMNRKIYQRMTTTMTRLVSNGIRSFCRCWWAECTRSNPPVICNCRKYSTTGNVAAATLSPSGVLPGFFVFHPPNCLPSQNKQGQRSHRLQVVVQFSHVVFVCFF